MDCATIVVMNLRSFFFSCVAVGINIPVLLFAQGLVPCGTNSASGLDQSCQTCHVMQLINGVAAWLVGILSVVVAIMIIIAGFRLLTANGNPSAISDAKGMIFNAFIGFAIVVAAWLLVDLFVKSLLSEETQTSMGPWNQIECVAQPSATTISDFLQIEILTAEDLAAAGRVGDPSVAPDLYPEGDCSPENLQAHGFTAQQSQVMSCLAQPESGCRNDADASENGLNSSARGVFQIVYGWPDDCHSLRLPECTAANGGVPLDCGASDDYDESPCNNAASNFACNAAAARCLLNGEAAGVAPGYQHWVADPRASVQAGCIARYAG